MLALDHPVKSVACPRCPSLRWPSTMQQIRFNRALAWALVVSPVVQIALGVNFWRGLAFDVVLLLAHGALSLKLFGMPKTAKTPTAKRALLVAGISPEPVGPRNKLLLGGYRVLLGTLYVIGAVFMSRYLPGGDLQALDQAAWLYLALGGYVMLRLPFSSLGHVFAASGYAARRQGYGKGSEFAAEAVVVAFVLASTWNLLR
jgi:hypothetical protein